MAKMAKMAHQVRFVNFDYTMEKFCRGRRNSTILKKTFMA